MAAYVHPVQLEGGRQEFGDATPILRTVQPHRAHMRRAGRRPPFGAPVTFRDGHDLDVDSLIGELTASGVGDLIEVTAPDEHVKVWIE